MTQKKDASMKAAASMLGSAADDSCDTVAACKFCLVDENKKVVVCFHTDDEGNACVCAKDKDGNVTHTKLADVLGLLNVTP